ncbi:response regulator [Lichenicola cladoniae]|uniref:histidine kinase n=1 Tax=Lichenicola cladoniae TaxID=1484109 RepID=A0A6M8HNS6_9PROT|nr:ATP-binding protein [Lichenicola cladoniae]NPD67500.1 response regulator [Acetobacteraceae bacterium]QKE89976.1 response regulator [Lichenicola cladoniae]
MKDGAAASIGILMIDDSVEAFMTLRAMLAPRRTGQRSYALSHTNDVADGLAAMIAGTHDLYLVDYRLRAESGLDLVRAARAAGVTRPIVMLTASGMVDVEALEAGANDFLVKGAFDLPMLERTIRYAMGNAESVRRLADLNARLEALVEERTRQYAEANERLTDQIAARELAENALMRAERLQALGRMTGSVAHDFNNILTALFGSLEILKCRLGDDVGPRIAGPLNTAVEAARVGERMVEGLLAFARRRPLAPRLLQLNEVIRDTEALLKLTLSGDVRLICDLADTLPQVLVDREQFERALLNLASNAHDAMVGQADARLTISTRADGPDRILLLVGDNGPGMSRDTLNHAFEPFFSTKEVGQGTGLGLAQVYGFALQSGGSASIDSQPGQGVRVRLVLPVAAGEPVEAATSTGPA